MLPNFIVIGAQRSGTTWIYENLRRHPDVFIPAKKELHFFDRHYEQGIAYYEAQFTDWAGQRAVGEATPAYLHGANTSRDIPKLIRHHLPQVKLIACLRNPVERAYSNYQHNVAMFDENLGLSFEEKLAMKPEIIEIGDYAAQLERYLAEFPRQQLLILLYDDLKRDPLAFLQSIYKFIGVDTKFSNGSEAVQRNAAIGKRNLARFRTVWHVERTLAKLGLAYASDRLRRWNSVAQPPMSIEVRKRLIEYYRPGNDRLSSLLGRSLEFWNA